MSYIRAEDEYAIAILVYLSMRSIVSGLGVATILEMSRALAIPHQTVTRLVGRMSALGWLETQRGARGGTALAKSAERLDLLSVLDGLRAGQGIRPCIERPTVCPEDSHCVLRDVWQDAQEALEAVLNRHTVDRIAHEQMRSSSDWRRRLRRPEPMWW